MPDLKILLVDDHAVVREGLRALIEAEPGLCLVAEAEDGESAFRQAVRLRPDLVVMDISLPQIGGAEATRRIRESCPEVRILALTAHEEGGYVRGLLEAGASGYVLKRAAAHTLVEAIRRVAAGETYLDPAVAAHVVSDYIRSHGSAPSADLSERETEVLKLIAQGYSNKEIATRLEISVKTVETYKARAMEKLRLNSRVDLVRFASQHGWLG